MRNLKNSWLLMGILPLILTSCLGDNDYTTDEWHWKNAQISSFSLTNDSIAGLSNVVFTIDQLNGKIFNRDSMPFGTVIENKLLCNMEFQIAATAVQIMAQATGDTVYWNGSDSVDFSQPVIFVVYAADGETTKTYEAKLNVHQLKPDSMVWNPFSTVAEGRIFEEMKAVEQLKSSYVFAKESGKVTLFKLSDAENPTEMALSGFPDDAALSSITECDGKLFVPDDAGKLFLTENGSLWSNASDDETPVIKCIIGSVRGNGVLANSLLSCIADVNGTLKFCNYTSGKGWKTGEEVPEMFPVTGFGSVCYDVMYYPHLVIASGRDKNGRLTNRAWSTMDGLSWIVLTNEKTPFRFSEGASVVRYNNLLFLIGGFDEEGKAIGDIESHEEETGEENESTITTVVTFRGTFFSKDNGVTWNDTVFFPTNYKPRGFSTVMVDNDRYMLLFGGKETKNGNIVNEVWRGRVNRFGFIIQD